VDTSNFLARIVPVGGNYLTITWTSAGRGFQARSWLAASGHAEAAGFAQWLASRNCDVYFGIAAYTAGEVRKDRTGKDYWYAKRDQANAQLLRVLVMDADVSRPGDGKDPAKVFPDRRAAAKWLVDFMAATGFPPPNLIVDSGYGNHWYWILEDALTPSAWVPLAYALRAAMMAHGWVGDTSPTVDSARILRPPGTVNMKSGTPVPVEIYPNSIKADYANQDIVAILAPWVVSQQATGTHGGATIHQLGPRPAHVPPGQGLGLNQAAHQGIDRRDYSFKRIASKCLQVGSSLAVNGRGDDYHLWTHHITLSKFCGDGEHYVHEISNGDPRYKPDETEKKSQQTEQEIAAKSLGAPLCASYDKIRTGICSKCPFQGQINSPLSLGAAEEDDLPHGYRRMFTGTESACIERFDKGEKGEGEWKFMLHGDAKLARVDRLGIGGHQLTFTYAWGNEEFPVAAIDYEMTHAPTIVDRLGKQGLSLYPHTATPVGRFVVAWINKLRAQHKQRADILKPFGWNFAAGERVGFAMAGDHYRSDGTVEHIAGGDPKISAMYRPIGNFDQWRTAAALFEHGRVDLQVLIATSFASPLIGLCGDVKGMTMNFWSTESGIGKTSAIRLGQSVWGDPRAMSSMTDTPNAVMKSLSELRTLTRFWDELRVVPSWQEKFTEMIYVIPQGRERARMQSDTTLREVGEWESFLSFTANRSMADLLVINNDGTDSGLQRLFELQMLKVQTAYDPSVGPVIKKLETNYGHAGRVYAAFLGKFSWYAEEKLTEILQLLTQDLGMQQEERFFVVACACILVGASLARKLGIFDFEVSKMYACLKTAFLAMRANRGSRTLVAETGGFDLVELMGRFITDNADWRLRTATFAQKGRGRLTPLAKPRGEGVRIQIAEIPGVLRISKNHFVNWLNEHNLPAGTVLDQLKQDMGAIQHRQTIAGGTNYSGGQVWCVDIPLIGSLAEHLNPADDTQVAPGAALAGTP
jgi:hypothetical protein